MRLVRLGNTYIDADRVEAIGYGNDGGTAVFVRGGRSFRVLSAPGEPSSMAPAEVAAAIEAATRDNRDCAPRVGSAGSCTVTEGPEPIPLKVGQVWANKSSGTQVRITKVHGDYVTRKLILGPHIGFESDTTEASFRNCWDTLVSDAPEPKPEPIPLAVGQVWGDSEGFKAKILSLPSEGRVEYQCLAEDMGPYLGSPNDRRNRPESHFRHYWNRLVSDAPAAEPAPQPSPQPDPVAVALLAKGKRLRYVRDGGAMGKRVPAELDVTVRNWGDSGLIFGRATRVGGCDAFPRFCSEFHRAEDLAARSMVELLSDLGYRFDRVIDSND